MISKAGLSETLMWRARAGQARRVASMLSPRDAALVEAYAGQFICCGWKARNTQQIGGPRCAERDAGDDHDVIAGLPEIPRERSVAGELRHRRLIGDFVFDHDRMNSPHRS